MLFFAMNWQQSSTCLPEVFRLVLVFPVPFFSFLSLRTIRSGFKIGELTYYYLLRELSIQLVCQTRKREVKGGKVLPGFKDDRINDSEFSH